MLMLVNAVKLLCLYAKPVSSAWKCLFKNGYGLRMFI